MFDSDLRLQAAQTEKIDFILSALVRACDAEAAILVSGGGQEMAAKGNLADFDRVAVASLSAGTLAVMAELAGAFGDSEFKGATHRGRERTILLRPVGRKALLVVMAGNSRINPRLGHTLARAVPLLTDILEPSPDDFGLIDSRERVSQPVL
jgi:predicted regulator of Ras-like GTPase activity (Roadblock/LC7/MglB family)